MQNRQIIAVANGPNCEKSNYRPMGIVLNRVCRFGLHRYATSAFGCVLLALLSGMLIAAEIRIDWPLELQASCGADKPGLTDLVVSISGLEDNQAYQVDMQPYFAGKRYISPSRTREPSILYTDVYPGEYQIVVSEKGRERALISSKTIHIQAPVPELVTLSEVEADKPIRVALYNAMGPKIRGSLYLTIVPTYYPLNSVGEKRGAISACEQVEHEFKGLAAGNYELRLFQSIPDDDPLVAKHPIVVGNSQAVSSLLIDSDTSSTDGEIANVAGVGRLQASEKVNEDKLVARNIASVTKTLPLEQEYLYDTESLMGSASTVWTMLSHKVLGQSNPQEVYDEFYATGAEYRSLAERELIYADRLMGMGKLGEAQQHVETAKQYVKLSNLSNDSAIQVFNGGVESASILAEGIYKASKASVIYGSKMTGLPPVALQMIDGVFTTLDYAIDVSNTGQSEANKKLIKNLAIKALISSVPVQSLGGRTLSESIADDANRIVGQSGMYELLNEVIESPQAKEEIMEFMAGSSAFVAKDFTKAGAKEAWQVNERLVDQMLSEIRSGLQSAEPINL